MILDNHNRPINYLRLAVTDRCNLRCFYCMPEEGIQFSPKQELLSFEEILRICTMMAQMGVNKIRITGGEPFLRKGLIDLLRDIKAIDGIDSIAITTNGTILHKYLEDIIDLGINQINLSIDSVDPQRFFQITKRDVFDQVWSCYQTLLESPVHLKLNAVVMQGHNIEDIIPMVALTETEDVSVRFIEEMPFNGVGKQAPLIWDYKKILVHIKSEFPKLEKRADPPGSTSLNYRIEAYKGTFGIIPAYTRSFCGSCNRIRLTPKGIIKTCLYDEGVFSLRDLLRAGASNDELSQAILQACSHRAKDGFEAESSRKGKLKIAESMATIGG